jgi:hypothetical protein
MSRRGRIGDRPLMLTLRGAHRGTQSIIGVELHGLTAFPKERHGAPPKARLSVPFRTREARSPRTPLTTIVESSAQECCL